MLNKLLFVVTQKLALLFIAGVTVVGSALTMGNANNPSSQTAIISNSLNFASSSAPIIVTLPNIPPGLLPSTTIPFCAASSTCAEKGLAKLVRSLGMVFKKAISPSPTPTSTSTPIVAAAKIIPPMQIAASTSIPRPAPTESITTQSFLADTTLSFKTTVAGTNELVFTTNLGGGNILTWGLLTTTIGGTNSIPEFSVTYSCTPEANQPLGGAPDQTPSFNVRSAYNCIVSLTPQTGSDRVTQSKDFSFTTPPGEFIVMPDPSMTSVLVNNTNNSGIIFNNQDSNPVTITSITFNASYAYLATNNLPLILRFQDPKTGASLVDYPLTNLPADPSASTTFSQTNITLPLPLTIPPLTQTFLPIQALGVQKMLILNTSPSVSMTLTGVAIGQSDVQVILRNPSVAWSCTVTTDSYNPNATSGVYVSGQSCIQ